MNKKTVAKFTRKAAKRKSRLAIGKVPGSKVITPKTKREPKYKTNYLADPASSVEISLNPTKFTPKGTVYSLPRMTLKAGDSIVLEPPDE